MKRRTFLQPSALLPCLLYGRRLRATEHPSMQIIDAHIYRFDPTRIGGVPWPKPEDKPEDKALCGPASPDRYERRAAI